MKSFGIKTILYLSISFWDTFKQFPITAVLLLYNSEGGSPPSNFIRKLCATPFTTFMLIILPLNGIWQRYVGMLSNTVMNKNLLAYSWSQIFSGLTILINYHKKFLKFIFFNHFIYICIANKLEKIWQLRAGVEFVLIIKWSHSFKVCGHL